MAFSSGSASLLDTSSLKNLRGARIAIVSTEWNERIIAKLLEGCVSVAGEFEAEIVHRLTVPGAVELPFACRALCLLEKDRPEAIIAFGAVIRGGTPHFDYVCDSVVQGITALNVSLEVPVIFGVLTLDNEEQAWERLGGTHGHKGKEAALAALKMIALKRNLASSLNQ